jgi:DNA-directed RNA polymerase subunit K/omega
MAMFNSELFTGAMDKIKHKYLLTNIVSMRMRQLSRGEPAMVDQKDMEIIDVALKEVAYGLLEAKVPEKPLTTDDIFE